MSNKCFYFKYALLCHLSYNNANLVPLDRKMELLRSEM
jgi:hypothetical protein